MTAVRTALSVNPPRPFGVAWREVEGWAVVVDFGSGVAVRHLGRAPLSGDPGALSGRGLVGPRAIRRRADVHARRARGAQPAPCVCVVAARGGGVADRRGRVSAAGSSSTCATPAASSRWPWRWRWRWRCVFVCPAWPFDPQRVEIFASIPQIVVAARQANLTPLGLHRLVVSPAGEERRCAGRACSPPASTSTSSHWPAPPTPTGLDRGRRDSAPSRGASNRPLPRGTPTTEPSPRSAATRRSSTPPTATSA